MEQAIAIEKKHFEPDHPKLAISYSNLAAILYDLGDLAGARRRIEQAIAIGEKHFEPDHPKLAISYNNLAHIELADGNKQKACELWRRAYVILTRQFDDDHPQVRNVAESLRRHCGGVPPRDSSRT
jgi:Flp pilus assembly protein TadD